MIGEQDEECREAGSGKLARNVGPDWNSSGAAEQKQRGKQYYRRASDGAVFRLVCGGFLDDGRMDTCG